MYKLRDFFNAVLPASGLVCSGSLSVPARGGMKHDTFNNVGAFVDALPVVTASKTRAHYFCISSLQNHSIVERGSHRVRTQTNTAQTKCFVVDIDVRDEPGHFRTKEAAMAGLRDMQDKLQMPAPIVVDSGRGYHCYWPMLEAIPSTMWTSTAKAFLRAAQLVAPEVVVDGSRVADSAGVLRIPETINHKSNTIVTIVEWYDELLDLGKFRATLGVADADDVIIKLPNLTRPDSPPQPLIKVARNCNWMKQYLANRATASEPEWYAVLGLTKFLTHEYKGETVEGEALAQLLSKGHAEYSESATATKYAQVLARQEGPTLCSRFEGIRPERCRGCPFHGGVKTPIQTATLDRPADKEKVVKATTTDESGNKVTETVTVPVYPKPYFRGEEGGVYVRGGGEEGIHRIYDYDVYATKRFRTEVIETEQLEVHFWLPRDGLRKVKIPTELLVDHKKLAQFLASRGMLTEFDKSRGLAKYMTTYARYLQQQSAADIEFSRFGWRDVLTEEPKFVVGNGYYNKSLELQGGSYASFLKDSAKAVACYGDLNEWRNGFGVYEGVPGSEAFQMAALLGFAAPLLALTEYSGVLYNIVGHSAAGKSTALKFMSSVWGQPNPNHILHTDTPISIFNMIGYLSSIPVAFDEVTKMDGDAVSDFVLSFTSGRGKMRANRNGENQANKVEWDTIVCSTSNTSIYDKLAASRKGYSAEAMRVFEVTVGASHPEHKAAIDAALIKIRENYGVAGREYIKFIMPRIEAVRKMVDTATATITNKGGVRNEERFWAVLLACVHVGGMIAKHKLQLHSYDVDRIVDWALGCAGEARESMTAAMSDPVTIIGEFFNANVHNVIRAVDGEVPSRMDTLAPREIKARLEYDGETPRVAYISVTALRRYCDINSIDMSWLRRELTENKVVRSSNGAKRLATGTKYHNPSVRTWTLDLTNPLIAGAVENLPEPGDVEPPPEADEGEAQ